ncbi:MULTISPECIES: putative 2OG-Fe(II) oxygenase [unclassified Novosphingobium]|uniref:putative 2OG-Fe(II) oxygenase n=1 Tax=unclassified Novosphingobium TaxID=2644732 RepID=UPI000D4D398F|nr:MULTISPECIES: putative 2OG-Fe(II) oxygenase [unclassified Novosphingobium]PTR05661.1 putative 2-oxoglutarate-Fe(II)-dependent oxygenase superfamily protein [Novosphingobium sp. GV055]PUA94232.1 putative 2-oxoglutarate-Fe(II)-dependent oxygenase superfamily protein [Novosphingobium sp. GV061]PUB12189.1 putative 2-oxoglutarate-Fe(II)-dependent oxygenase superfamily protein [Novosphingobium sp. GV079]PUB37213.1 putative 2-oxoglutarate-Fe(II)-dependent oxygenase superfamily protein [Novosphingob
MSESTGEWLDRARILRARQDMMGAHGAMARAHALAPDDPAVAFLHAQSCYELGHPAAHLFATVCRRWPDHLDAQRNHALALASEGQVAKALATLEAALARHPAWADGHRVLGSLRWVNGDRQTFDASFARAARAHPAQPALWLGWFAAVAQVRDWPRAAAILDEAERHLGTLPALIQARVFLAGESGDGAGMARLINQGTLPGSPLITIARIRQALRDGAPDMALALALPLTQLAPGSALAGQVWPYVSTCWRLLDDPRTQWLDGDPAFVRSVAVGLSTGELAQLADLLRGLHRAQLPYPEQSVRGGTQTDRSVLLRHEPALVRTREALLAATRDYIAALPPPDPAHPLLSRPRAAVRISGSWSVRLHGQGFNVTHSHPLGWISSAFYVALPDPAESTAPDAGHFHYGAPPQELGLDLAPYGTIAPMVGQLVLFPSTLWHGTVPFDAGERLNIAFDVVPAP